MTRRRVSPTARAGAPSDVRVAVLATSAERARWAARAAEAGLTLSEVARAAWNTCLVVCLVASEVSECGVSDIRLEQDPDGALVQCVVEEHDLRAKEI